MTAEDVVEILDRLDAAGWQANLNGPPHRWPREHLDASGRIGGREIRCITPELQVRWHAYVSVDDVAWADMHALAARFALELAAALAAPPGFAARKRAPRRV